jgi:hypothetical protein
MTVVDAINQLADREDGFEWDIVPDPAAPYTALKFHVWSKAEGGRNQNGTAPSSLILDDGGSLAGWDHNVVSSEFANVTETTGAVAAFNTAPSDVWVPTSTAPAAVPPLSYDPRGAWERTVELPDASSTLTVAQQAQAEFDKRFLFHAEVSADLARGRWLGKDQLWIGDNARVIITEPVVGSPGEYILYIDEAMKVYGMEISVDDLGAEDVGLSLNRERFDATKDTRSLTDRVKRLERR